MNVWNQAPLVRLILPFIGGIITAIYYPFQHFYLFLLSLLLLIAFGVLVLVPAFYVTYKKSWWFGLLTYCTLFLLAFQVTTANTIRLNFNYFQKNNSSDTVVFYKVKLIEPVQEKQKSVKAVVQIQTIKQKTGWKSVEGKALLYFQKNNRSFHLNYGDELVVKTVLKEIEPPQNPSQFNYKQFLSFHNIYHQAYVSDNNWLYTGKNSGNNLIAFCLKTRAVLLDILKQFQVSDDEYAVGAALLLGYEDKLDADILSAYSGTGAMHVLSVSGLHVGIIFIVFNWLLLFFDKIKYGNVYKAAILICLLWFYAALTGLSPSVLRAASMFSFIVVAKSFNRYTNIYNTLAASAFVLLAINPYIIMEVGFQLSYLAVIGIVYIQPKIYNWFNFQNRLIDNMWSVTTVSVAAQIATFPLGLHYFHQFPNYFLLSNLIVIPISTLIIYSGIALFCFSKIPVFAKYIALLFVSLLSFLNFSVKYIEQLPSALLQGISISVLETWIIYAIIIFFLFYFIQRKYMYLLLSCSALLVMLFVQIVEQQKEFSRKRIVVYNISKTSAIDFIDSKSNVLFTDSALAYNQSALLYNVKHNWWNLGVTNSKIITDNYTNKHLFIHHNFIQFYNKRIVIFDKTAVNIKKGKMPVAVDYLVVSKNIKMKLNEMLYYFSPQKIIFDSSVSLTQLSKWKKECVALKKDYYSVIDSGALEIEL
jgi:competence protein ComEC